MLVLVAMRGLMATKLDLVPSLWGLSTDTLRLVTAPCEGLCLCVTRLGLCCFATGLDIFGVSTRPRVGSGVTVDETGLAFGAISLYKGLDTNGCSFRDLLMPDNAVLLT